MLLVMQDFQYLSGLVLMGVNVTISLGEITMAKARCAVRTLRRYTCFTIDSMAPLQHAPLPLQCMVLSGP